MAIRRSKHLSNLATHIQDNYQIELDSHALKAF